MAPTPDNVQSAEQTKRRAWPGPVGDDVGHAARSAFARAGFTDPTLVLRWTEIAGSDTARLARPIRLSEGPSGGTLTLKAEAAAALFLQHESRALCERINAYLGRPAVSKLRFVQGPLRPSLPPPKVSRTHEVAACDPAMRWRGADHLGRAILNLARRRIPHGYVD